CQRTQGVPCSSRTWTSWPRLIRVISSGRVSGGRPREDSTAARSTLILLTATAQVPSPCSLSVTGWWPCARATRSTSAGPNRASTWRVWGRGCPVRSIRSRTTRPVCLPGRRFIMPRFSRDPLTKMLSLRVTQEQDLLLDALAEALELPGGKAELLRKALDYW